MAKYHRGAPIKFVKTELIKDFCAWCEKVRSEQSNENLIEFLIQKNFIQGKDFLEYCDSIDVSVRRFVDLEHRDFLREGFIPYNVWIGARKGKKDD